MESKKFVTRISQFWTWLRTEQPSIFSQQIMPAVRPDTVSGTFTCACVDTLYIYDDERTGAKWSAVEQLRNYWVIAIGNHPRQKLVAAYFLFTFCTAFGVGLHHFSAFC